MSARALSRLPVDADLAIAAAAELDAQSTGEVIACVMDVSDAETVLNAAQKADERFGGIDIWVNNAGISTHVPIDGEDWEARWQRSLDGTFGITQLCDKGR